MGRSRADGALPRLCRAVYLRGGHRIEGINDCYQKLCLLHGGPHDAEHQMMECLGEALWTAQRNQTAPDEVKYLDCLKKIAQIS